MSALTAARVVLCTPGAIKNVTYPLAIGAKAFENGMCCYDTGAYGAVKQGAVSTTLVPIGTFIASYDNTSGGANVPIGIELFKEHPVTYWDSVTGGGAITIANLFQLVYIADDHTLTTVSTGASAFGRVWWVSPPGYPGGVGVEQST
jgi:hypothetical protein